MPIIEFSAEDLARGTIVPPAWYRVKIGRFQESLSKDGNSTNWVFEDSKIIRNADDGTTTFIDANGMEKQSAGVPLAIRFNSKAKGFTEGLFRALGVDIQAGSRFELKNAEDKEVDVFVENDTYDGRIVNRINHKYRKPRE